MEKSNLNPFVRQKLDILFVGLNPAKGSSDNKHYFSVNQALWNQLYESGLITSNVDKSNADILIFASSKYNYNTWNYGITDLVTNISESNSRRIKPSELDAVKLVNTILQFKPRAVIILHGKVMTHIYKYIGLPNKPSSNAGHLGKLLDDSETVFYGIAFPHGNTISSENKIDRYREVKEYLMNKQ